MTYLADWMIGEMVAKGELVIEPWRKEALQPVSYDIHLGPIVKCRMAYIGDSWHDFDLDELGPQYMPKGKFFLAATVERFELPANVVGEVRDKSSLAREGIFMSHGLIDPGFRGHITLELINHSESGFSLRSGMPIGQVTFQRVAAPVSRKYGDERLGSHYQDQEPTPQIARA